MIREEHTATLVLQLPFQNNVIFILNTLCQCKLFVFLLFQGLIQETHIEIFSS